MKGGALPSLSSRDRLPGLAVATPGLCYVPHKSSSCFTDALTHLGAGLICQAELPGKFFCGVTDTVTNPAAFLVCSLSPSSFLQRAPLMPSDAADSRSREAGCHGEFILCYCICHCFHRRCWPPPVLIRMLPQFCNSKQNRYLRLGWSQRVFTLQKPLPIAGVGAQLWQAVENLGGIRSQGKGGGVVQRAQGNRAVFLQLKLYTAKTDTFRGWEIVTCSVLHTSSLISFWSSHPWSHCQPPLLPLVITSFFFRGGENSQHIITLWGNISVFAHTIHTMY